MNISIKNGSHITINYNCTFIDNTDIAIGNHVLIGPSTGLFMPSILMSARKDIA